MEGTELSLMHVIPWVPTEPGQGRSWQGWCSQKWILHSFRPSQDEARMGGPGLGSTQTLCISTMEQREVTSKPSARAAGSLIPQGTICPLLLPH